MTDKKVVKFGASEMHKILKSKSFPAAADNYAAKKSAELSRNISRDDRATRGLMLARALGDEYLSAVAQRSAAGFKRLPPGWWGERRAVWEPIVGDVAPSNLKKMIDEALKSSGVDPQTGEVRQAKNVKKCVSVDQVAAVPMPRLDRYAIVSVVAAVVSMGCAIYSTLAMLGV